MKPVQNICFGCAELYGAEMPTSETKHTDDDCGVCGSYTGTCSILDLRWPDGMPEKWKISLKQPSEMIQAPTRTSGGTDD